LLRAARADHFRRFSENQHFLDKPADLVFSVCSEARRKNGASAGQGAEILSARIPTSLSHPDPSAMRRARETFSDGDVRAIAPLIQALDGLGRRRRVDCGAGGAAQTGEPGGKEKSALGVRASP
jgi:hypothetical protein